MADKDDKDNIVYVYEDFDHQLIKSRRSRFIVTVIIVISYLLLYFLKIRLSRIQSDTVEIFGLNILYTTVLSTISQIQTCTMILLIIIQRRRGYIIDLILLGFSLVGTSIGAIIEGNMIALQGIFTHFLTFIVVHILYYYIHLCEKKFGEVVHQREEILSLYEEISASENDLIEQKLKLERCNAALMEREDKLNQLAFYDCLTGLPNRRMIMERIDAMLKSASLENQRFSVVVVDLDNFKKINDSAGHLYGDGVLCEIANRWEKGIHKDDIIGRLGGDEFIIIIQRSLSNEEIIQYVESLYELLNEHVSFKQREFYVKASFGISVYPDDGDNAEVLIKYADVAMYKAKLNKSNKIQKFNRELQEQFQYNMLLEDYMQQVLIRNELSVVFQPQFETNTKKLRGFEALARWITKDIGFIPPKDFIPIAEENGMILSMGEWILKESCRICRLWMELCNTKFTLSVNVSAVQLLDAGFISMVDNVIKETKFDPNCLEIEVTESMFIVSKESAIETLTELKKRGITIALDDFGTGYASLSYLQCLPIDIMKIDKTFIDGIIIHNKHQALVKSLVTIAHELSIEVIAEGVEQQVQLDILKEVRCDYIQGYLLGKPVDAERALEIVRESKEIKE